MNVKVIYGSTTGTTQAAAERIAAALGTTAIDVAGATAGDFDADLLVLGSSTWGCGDLQDDWAKGIELLGAANLAGKKVAVFGYGDQTGFADTFCDAIGIIAAKAQERGAELVGQVSKDGYLFDSSKAVQDGRLVGLALDDNNQAGLSEQRLTDWLAALKTCVGA
ncbi:MAG: flavodoxin [Planctomycetes bacterium]|nr:flavodoxin [Planctomycetota bacterium]